MNGTEKTPYMIEAKNIQIAYGKKKVLTGVDLCADRGECIGLIGANGCGKSTLLKVFAGVLKPSSGHLQYYGHEAAGNAKLCRKMAGYVPQDNPLMEELSVYDNLRLWYPNKKELEKELESGFLAVMGVSDYIKTRVSKLSGGMKKKVTLGIALSQTPPVLLMDEPGAALDLPARGEMRGYLEDYLDRKGTVLIASHEESELDLCDRLYVMKKGRLHEVDPNMRGEDLIREMSV